MTEQLYYKNIAQTQFEAEVLEAVEEKKQWKVLLDKTCFYPEGGGQPADKGWINDVPVSDVQKEGDSIYHWLPGNPGGGMIKGKIDTRWRRDFMQQHTGQHIISGALWKVGNYKTVSVHMGIDYTTIEIETAAIPEGHLIETEKLANRVIADDMPVASILTNHRELHRFPLRKPIHREGNIRLVKIGDFDCAGCGGLHFQRTGEVRLVKATGMEKIRGNTRIAWKIGERAIEDYNRKDKIISRLKPLLETREDEFHRKTKELMEELTDHKKKYRQMERRLAESIAGDLYRDREELPGSAWQLIVHSLKGEDDRLMMTVMKHLLEKENLLVCLLNVIPGKLRWSIGCSSRVDFDFNRVKGELLPVIDGKGGGRYPLWQGSGSKPEAAGDFLEHLRTLYK
ncbi:MAG: hypothetical protein GY940_16745 [bacterium]|nr:hypothetical protein [bacterium]